MSAIREYAHDVLRRARVPMEPLDYVVDWLDQPRRHKVYPNTTMVPLPAPADEPGELLAGEVRPDAGPFDVGALSNMLANSYGITGRRLAIHTNEDVGGLPYYRTATWSRGTANGGGLYPLEVTLISGPSSPLRPGVYGYASAHHGLTQLASGDVSARIADALAAAGHESNTDQYLVVSVKFWKNAFKYNTFCYHVVSMDVGALLGTWRLWAAANGRRLRVFQWFDEQAVNDVLGVDGVSEGAFAVVALTPERPAAEYGSPGAPKAHTVTQESERSQTIRTFDRIELVHKATAAEATLPHRVPVCSGSSQLSPMAVPLGRAAEPRRRQSDALRMRRSSFGRFADTTPLGKDALHHILRAGAEALGVADEFARAPLTRLAVFVNHVEGVSPGSYTFHPESGSLDPIKLGAHGLLLQRSYFLQNYNLEQAAAVVVVLAKPFSIMDIAGDRGYRVVNAAVGSIAQQLYTAAAAVDVGAGAALGFDNVGLLEALGGPTDATSREVGTDVTTEWPMLIVAIGNERPSQANFSTVMYAHAQAPQQERGES